MPIPNDIQTATEAHLDQYCARLIPEHAYGKVRVGYVVAGMSITLFEQHPHFQDKSTWIRHDVARIRYSKTDSSWTLYCLDMLPNYLFNGVLGTFVSLFLAPKPKEDERPQPAA